MKILSKILVVSAVAGGAVIGFSGPASAHAICSPHEISSHSHLHNGHEDRWYWKGVENSGVGHYIVHWQNYTHHYNVQKLCSY
jgi:hypothetical protein